jgi:hypothetical protein
MLAIQGDFAKFAIICESVVCNAGSSLVESLDLLFKMLWVFKMQYPSGLKMFFTFIQQIFGIKYGSERIPSRVIEVARLVNVNRV